LRILAVSDLHGDLHPVHRACALVNPAVILSCGDWGDAEEVSERALAAFLAKTRVYTTFGNHDPLELLARLVNRDGSPVLIAQGGVQEVSSLKLAAIGGIWAKSHAKPHYVTDADVARAAERIARAGPVDILLTHACPVGLADLTPGGRHGGQRSFLDAFKRISPRVHLCGHLHLAQERVLKDGRKIINVGATSDGSFAVIEFDPYSHTLDARLETLPQDRPAANG
jgi:Icc-related predicted phosphoesterase